MKKMNEEDMINETIDDGVVAVESKPGFFGYVKDHWVPFLVGTVAVTALGVIAGCLLGSKSDDVDGDEILVDAIDTDDETEEI